MNTIHLNVKGNKHNYSLDVPDNDDFRSSLIRKLEATFDESSNTWSFDAHLQSAAAPIDKTQPSSNPGSHKLVQEPLKKFIEQILKSAEIGERWGERMKAEFYGFCNEKKIYAPADISRAKLNSYARKSIKLSNDCETTRLRLALYETLSRTVEKSTSEHLSSGSFFSPLEVKALLSATRNVKHKLMFLLCYKTSLKAAQLTELTTKDLNLQEGMLKYKDETFRLNEFEKGLFAKYQAVFQPYTWLFEGHFGGQYEIRNLQIAFKKSKEIAKLRDECSLLALSKSLRNTPTHDLLGSSDIFGEYGKLARLDEKKSRNK